jgi:hypothetical protein
MSSSPNYGHRTSVAFSACEGGWARIGWKLRSSIDFRRTEMSRRTWGLFAVIAVVGALAVATAAIAKPITPSSGPFSGSTSQKQEAIFGVSKAGSGRKVELKAMSIEFNCSFQGGTAPLNVFFSSKTFKENEKGLPLPVKNGKFSYKGPLYIGTTHPTINFSGSFKSPTKVVGKVSVTAFTAEPVVSLISNCEPAAVTFNSKHF